jgi:hypothetical protein
MSEVLGAGMWSHPDIVCGSPRPAGFGHCRTSCPSPKQACLCCCWAPETSQLPVLPADLMAWCPGFAGCVDSLPCPASHTSVLDARSVGECRDSCTNSYLFPAFLRAWHSGSTEAENKCDTMLTSFQMTQCPSCFVTSPRPSLWALV